MFCVFKKYYINGISIKRYAGNNPNVYQNFHTSKKLKYFNTIRIKNI